MKNIHFIIEGILAVAIIVLFSMQLSNKPQTATIPETGEISASGPAANLPIAYINVDSLLTHYKFSIELNEQLLRKQESSLAIINEKGKDLESQIQEFTRKIQNNAFLSPERAQNEEARLSKKQKELQELQQKLSNEYTQEQMAMNAQLRDSIYTFLKSYVKGKTHQIIFSNSFNDNILYSEEEFNITDEVIEMLNVRYNTSKK